MAAGAGDQAAGALGVGVDRPGPLSVVLGTSGVVFAALPGVRRRPGRRACILLPRRPGRWHAMGVMLSAAGSLGWLRERRSARAARRVVAEAEPLAAGCRGAAVPPIPRRRAHAARRSRARGGLRRPLASPRPRRARPRRARGRGVRLARLSGAPPRARGASPSRHACPAAGPGASSGSEIVASVLELPLERTAAEEGAAFGAALLGGVAQASSPTPHEAVAATSASATRSSPSLNGSSRTRRPTAAFALSIRLYDLWRTNDLSRRKGRARSPARAAASARRSRTRSLRTA